MQLAQDVPGVALRERYGLRDPIPLDALCLGHADTVADGGQGLERSTAPLLVMQGAVLSWIAVCYLPQKVAVGLGDCGRHCHGAVGEDLEVRERIEGHALLCAAGVRVRPGEEPTPHEPVRCGACGRLWAHAAAPLEASSRSLR